MKDNRRNDISETNPTEVSLRESEEIMRYIVRHDPSAIAIFDCNLHYIAVSNRYLHDYNVREENIIGKHHYEVFPELPQNWKDVHQRCLAGAIEKNEDDCFVRPDGSITYNRWECRPWRRENGAIGGIIIYSEVTTDRKKAEKALHESEIKYRAFFENSMDAILLTSPDGKIYSANPAACSMFGYSEDELIKIGKSGIEDTSDPGLSNVLAERKLKGKAQGIITFFRKDGSRFTAEISTSLFLNNEGLERSSMIIRDITERKKIQQEIKFKADLLNNVGQAVIATDEQNTVTYWNRAAEKIYGWSSNEAIGQNIAKLIPSNITQEQTQEIKNKLSNGKAWSGEFLVMRKDGFNFPAYVTQTPILDSKGKLTGAISISNDITERKLAEQSLLDSEERFRHSFDYAAAGICLVGIDGKFLRINKAFEEMIGYEQDELKHLTFNDITYPEDLSIGLNQLQKMLAGEIDHISFEKRYQRKNHQTIWAYLSTSLIRDAHRKPQFFITQIIDVTQRKQDEREITMLAHSLKSIHETVCITDLDDIIVFVNESFLKTYGYKINEIVGKPIDVIRSSNNDQAMMNEILPTTLRGEWQGELFNKRKDGSEFPVFLSSSIIKDKENKAIGLIGVASDITERKASEELLLKLSSAVEQTIDTIAITDQYGTIEYVNKAFEDITGYTSEEAVGKTPRILKSGIKGREFYEALWETILSGKVFMGEVVNKKKNGELFYEQKTISPIFDKNGNITHFVGTGVDISGNKRTKEALLESEKLYRSLFENMLNGFAYCEMIFEQGYPQDFIFLAVNESFERLTSLKNVIGKKISEVIPGISESNPDMFEIYGRVALTGQPETFETYVEGLKMWFSVSVYSPQKGYFVTVFDMITARKNAEEVLLQSEAKFRKLINSLPDSVLVVDTLGQIVFCNEIAMKTFNYATDEMLGCSIETLLPQHLREPHVALRNEFIPEPTGRPMGEGQELSARRKDGSEFPTEIMLEPVEINNNQFILAIIRDITDRKIAEYELIKAKEKAEESDRLKSAFLANMSHEVRTPLNSIIGFSELLADPDFEEEHKNEFIHHIINNGNNLLTIISDIMDISKMESGQITIRKSQVKVQKFISDIKNQFTLQVEAKNLAFKLTLPETDEETVIFADPDRLSQIFNNLISNAIKFTANGSIEIGYQTKENFVEFYISDTGIGIAAEYYDKIYERFRQVESEKTRKYGGNGLGLAISKNLIELMGGKIWFESELGIGSTFYFTIPAKP